MKNKIIFIFIIILIFSFCTTKRIKTVPGEKEESKTIPSDKKEKTKKAPPPLKPEDVPLQIATQEQEEQKQAKDKKIRMALSEADIKEVLLALTKNTKYSLYLEPDVSGTIELADFKEISLNEALDYILPSLGLEYKIEKGNILHVYKRKMNTRVFTMDFIAATRKGKRRVSFSTRSQTGRGITGGAGTGGTTGGGYAGAGTTGTGTAGGMGNQNASISSIETNTESTVWEELIGGLASIFGKGKQTIPKGDSSKESVTGINISTEDGRRLIVSPKTGVIFITDYPDRINLISNFLSTFEDSIHREVWIEAKILEVTLDKAHQTGINWTSVFNFAGFYGTLPNTDTIVFPSTEFDPGNTILEKVNPSYGVFRYSVSNNKIEMMLEALSRQGELKVLSSPRLSTLNNEKAIIRVVREEVFFSSQSQTTTSVGGAISATSLNLQVVPVGIVMDIIPQISPEGNIILSINPDISHLVTVKEFQTEGATARQPVIDRRSVDTVAKVREGETVVIGGIMEERKQEILRGVPFLMKLPILGSLFRRTEQEINKTELVILITPHLMVGKKIKVLTDREIKRVKNALTPFHLSDIVSFEEGISGEINNKKEKKEE